MILPFAFCLFLGSSVGFERRGGGHFYLAAGRTSELS
jgi:hypothetical protein